MRSSAGSCSSKKTVHVGRNLILVAENHVVVFVDGLLRLIVHELQLCMHRHQHRGHFAGGGFEQHRVGFNRKHFAVQDGVGGFRILHDAVFRPA